MHVAPPEGAGLSTADGVDPTESGSADDPVEIDEASSSRVPRSPADAATYRSGVDVRASQIAEAGRGAFTTVEFAQGDYVTEYAHVGGVLSKADVARLTVQTHVLTLANQHVHSHRDVIIPRDRNNSDVLCSNRLEHGVLTTRAIADVAGVHTST